MSDALDDPIDDNTVIQLAWDNQARQKLSVIEEMDPDTITESLICEGLLLETVRAFAAEGQSPTVGEVRRNLRRQVGNKDWPTWQRTLDAALRFTGAV